LRRAGAEEGSGRPSRGPEKTQAQKKRGEGLGPRHSVRRNSPSLERRRRPVRGEDEPIQTASRKAQGGQVLGPGYPALRCERCPESARERADPSQGRAEASERQKR